MTRSSYNNLMCKVHSCGLCYDKSSLEQMNCYLSQTNHPLLNRLTDDLPSTKTEIVAKESKLKHKSIRIRATIANNGNIRAIELLDYVKDISVINSFIEFTGSESNIPIDPSLLNDTVAIEALIRSSLRSITSQGSFSFNIYGPNPDNSLIFDYNPESKRFDVILITNDSVSKEVINFNNRRDLGERMKQPNLHLNVIDRIYEHVGDYLTHRILNPPMDEALTYTAGESMPMTWCTRIGEPREAPPVEVMDTELPIEEPPVVVEEVTVDKKAQRITERWVLGVFILVIVFFLGIMVAKI